MKLIALALGMFAFGCSGEADIGGTNKKVTICDPQSCTDPAPLSPNFQCADGSVAGPACVEAAGGGSCQWEVLECPDTPTPTTCTPSDCPSPAPAGPNYTCTDGTIAGPTCTMTPTGCGWQITQCPDPTECQPDSCPPPAPASPNYLCPDGTIAGPACRTLPTVPPTASPCGWTIVQCP